MATTTNYGWTTPDDTDLVKDGAAAIRTLGSSVDTTTKALNPSTTEGDIEYRSATANTNTRLGIGTDGQILTVAAGVPSWATPGAGGGMTSIASGSLSGAALSLTSISGSYKDLRLVIRGFKTTTQTDYDVNVNNNTGSNYQLVKMYADAATFVSSATDGDTRLRVNGDTVKQNIAGGLIIDLLDYANTTAPKLLRTQMTYQKHGTVSENTVLGLGTFFDTSAITQIDLTIGAGNWNAGTYILYGVN